MAPENFNDQSTIKPSTSILSTTPPAKSGIDFKLLLITIGAFVVVTVLLVNTLGMIAAGVSYAIFKRNTGQKELWIYGTIVMVYSLLRDLLQRGVLFEGREIAVTTLAGVLMGLFAVGVAALCYFIRSKIVKPA